MEITGEFDIFLKSRERTDYHKSVHVSVKSTWSAIAFSPHSTVTFLSLLFNMGSHFELKYSVCNRERVREALAFSRFSIYFKD